MDAVTKTHYGRAQGSDTGEGSVKGEPRVFARSLDGKWFDGYEWHNIPPQWEGDDEGTSDPVTINSDEYPALATLISADGDFSAYLSAIGIDLAEYASAADDEEVDLVFIKENVETLGLGTAVRDAARRRASHMASTLVEGATVVFDSEGNRIGFITSMSDATLGEEAQAFIADETGAGEKFESPSPSPEESR